MKDEKAKGEYDFFVGETDKLKARLDLLETESEQENKEVSRFFLGTEDDDKTGDGADHKHK